MKLPSIHASMHPSIHPSTQQIFIEHPYCASFVWGSGETAVGLPNCFTCTTPVSHLWPSSSGHIAPLLSYWSEQSQIQPDSREGNMAPTSQQRTVIYTVRRPVVWVVWIHVAIFGKQSVTKAYTTRVFSHMYILDLNKQTNKQKDRKL
jgi:hypothetical protein